ncbi:hypothetical protein MASR1M60_19890 [Rhodocyclaceae bacterium]
MAPPDSVMVSPGLRCDSPPLSEDQPITLKESDASVDNQITSLDKFRVPVGNQEIELQQVDFEAGGMPVLRLRIREHRRFTIFDIDPVTAGHWAEVMAAWSKKQLSNVTSDAQS